MRRTLKVGQVNWSYLDSGEGSELWVAFHGYGQEAEVMHHFMRYLRPNSRILSFDLPYHGQTAVDRNFLLTGDLSELIGMLVREHRVSKCSLLGFSLGGKIVLKLVELVPGKIDRIVLIAPDGLKVNPIYNFVTNTSIGRSCFRLVINFPLPFFAISRTLSTLGLMKRRIHRFVTSQMRTKEKREKVFKVWQMFKRIDPVLKDVRSKIWRYHIRPTLVFGRRDRVIRPKLARRLSGENCTTAEVIMIDTGHRLITREHAEFLNGKLGN